MINEHCGPRKPRKEKEKFEFVLKVPFINEKFTRIVKSYVKKSGFKARVVVECGISLKDLTRKKISTPCNCLSCNLGVPCSLRNFVYKANCQKCDEEYIGCSYRPAGDRIGEHVASVRLKNKRTTLGQHMLEHTQEEARAPGNNRRPRVTGAEKIQRDKMDAQDMEKAYKFSIARKCKNSLETFISEGLHFTNKGRKAKDQ